MGAVPEGDKGTLKKYERTMGLEGNMDAFMSGLGDPDRKMRVFFFFFVMSCSEECGEVK